MTIIIIQKTGELNRIILSPLNVSWSCIILLIKCDELIIYTVSRVTTWK